jgi:ribosome-binding protein aMBF1 (putative translation factor)
MTTTPAAPHNVENAPDPLDEFVPWEEVRDAHLAAMSPRERREYQAALYEAQATGDIQGIVYNARKEAGLSQTALAKKAGTSQSVISLIENGGQTATLPMLYRIADALGKKVEITLTDA